MWIKDRLLSEEALSQRTCARAALAGAPSGEGGGVHAFPWVKGRLCSEKALSHEQLCQSYIGWPLVPLLVNKQRTAVAPVVVMKEQLSLC